MPFYAYQSDMYFLVAEGPMLLSCVTAHKITNFKCKYLATMVMGDDDDDNEDGATMTTTTTMVTEDGIQRRWWQTTTTMRLMAMA